MMRIDWRKAATFSLALFCAAGLAAQGGAGGAGIPTPGGATPGAGPSQSAPGGGVPDRSGGPFTGAATREGAGRDAVEAFGRWLETSGEVSRFLPVRYRLLAAAVPAIEAGAPAEAFRIRLREAAAKGASPETTADALEADAARWTALARLIGTDWPPASKSAAFYVSAALAMRNGIELEAVAGVAAWARAEKSSPERAAAALTAAATLRAAISLSPAEAGRAALAVAASRLKVGHFDDLVELAERAARSGLSPFLFLAALESTFGSGEGLEDLERRLFPQVFPSGR
ncbi:MAG: hypothetical protein JXA15_08675 [Spirochaetales bacterium]|nr:hypothetical protein [Spirochaetales bacterium]